MRQNQKSCVHICQTTAATAVQHKSFLPYFFGKKIEAKNNILLLYSSVLAKY